MWSVFGCSSRPLKEREDRGKGQVIKSSAMTQKIYKGVGRAKRGRGRTVGSNSREWT